MEAIAELERRPVDVKPLCRSCHQLVILSLLYMGSVPSSEVTNDVLEKSYRNFQKHFSKFVSTLDDSEDHVSPKPLSQSSPTLFSTSSPSASSSITSVLSHSPSPSSPSHSSPSSYTSSSLKQAVEEKYQLLSKIKAIEAVQNSHKRNEEEYKVLTQILEQVEPQSEAGKIAAKRVREIVNADRALFTTPIMDDTEFHQLPTPPESPEGFKQLYRKFMSEKH